jgi:hypothetical protein
LESGFLEFNWRTFSAGNTVTPNSRMISPWLMRVGWHLYVKEHDAQQLCDLVAMPKAPEFPGLQTAIQQYFERATALIEQTDELVLQRLNTADPVKRCVMVISLSLV